MTEPPESIDSLLAEFPHFSKQCRVHPSVYLAPGVVISGDVQVGELSNIWCNAVLRGDVNAIRVGRGTNIQDLCLIHNSYQVCPTLIGDWVTVGHSAVLHGCEIADRALIGMGSVILDRAKIGEYALIGAGSLVTEGKVIPAGAKALGRPAKVVGEVTDDERRMMDEGMERYLKIARLARHAQENPQGN